MKSFHLFLQIIKMEISSSLKISIRVRKFKLISKSYVLKTGNAGLTPLYQTTARFVLIVSVFRIDVCGFFYRYLM